MKILAKATVSFLTIIIASLALAVAYKSIYPVQTHDDFEAWVFAYLLLLDVVVAGAFLWDLWNPEDVE